MGDKLSGPQSQPEQAWVPGPGPHSPSKAMMWAEMLASSRKTLGKVGWNMYRLCWATLGSWSEDRQQASILPLSPGQGHILGNTQAPSGMPHQSYHAQSWHPPGSPLPNQGLVLFLPGIHYTSRPQHRAPV